MGFAPMTNSMHQCLLEITDTFHCIQTDNSTSSCNSREHITVNNSTFSCYSTVHITVGNSTFSYNSTDFHVIKLTITVALRLIPLYCLNKNKTFFTIHCEMGVQLFAKDKISELTSW